MLNDKLRGCVIRGFKVFLQSNRKRFVFVFLLDTMLFEYLFVSYCLIALYLFSVVFDLYTVYSMGRYMYLRLRNACLNAYMGLIKL